MVTFCFFTNWLINCSETMKICADLDLPFTVPSYIMQDASSAEANAAKSVFGETIVILMCWFHMIFNVKKHESLKDVPGALKIYEFRGNAFDCLYNGHY